MKSRWLLTTISLIKLRRCSSHRVLLAVWEPAMHVRVAQEDFVAVQHMPAAL